VQQAKAELVQAILPDGAVAQRRLTCSSWPSRPRPGPASHLRPRGGADVRLGEVTPAAGGLAFTLACNGRGPGAPAPSRPAQRLERGRGRGGRPRPASRSRSRRAVSPARCRSRAARVAPGRRGPRPRRHLQREPGLLRRLDALRDAGPDGGRGRLRRHAGAGAASGAAHARRGWIAALPAAGLATAGTAARATAAVAAEAGCPDVAAHATPEEAAGHVAARVRAGDRVLVKGSRGMRMERAVEALLARLREGGRPC
jgi:hypothetical protein